MLRPSRSSFQTTSVSPSFNALRSFLVLAGLLPFRSFFLRKFVHILRVRALAAEDPYFGHLLTPLHSQFAYFSPSYFSKKIR